MIKFCGGLPAAPKEKKHSKVSNQIITFDIETTSLFEYPDGWRCFRPKLQPSFYQGRRKAAVPYIWMFGIEARSGEFMAYYGRNFNEVADVLKLISNPYRRKIIYIHNAAFEFQFLRDIFDANGWTVEKMLARSTRKPISWVITELNIEFKCSYMLTGLSLEKAAEEYTDAKKRVGDLIYTVPRSPVTPLTDTELMYCEMDVITLCKIIAHYRTQYGGQLNKIPYTLTGEVRKELKKYMSFNDILKVAKKTPEMYVYLLLMKAFQGGITHACYIYANKTMRNIISGDMASAYPAAMLAEKFPMSKWLKVPPDVALKSSHDKWAVLYHVKLHNIRSKYMNRYILGSKALHSKGLQLDNGRAISAEMIELVLTDVDYDIIKRCYEIGEIEYIETYVNRKDYLPRPLIEYVLTLYQRKTELKGIPEKIDLYRRSKSQINSTFGCCCTNVMKQTTIYQNGEWNNLRFDEAFIQSKLDELKHSKGNCFSYSYGVWITAYCRARTWEIACFSMDPSIVGLNKGSIYYDTDSCKAPDSPEFRAALKKNSEEYQTRLAAMCDALEIDIERTRPADKKGVKHPIGVWEIDDHYREFKTLGAKRYAHRSAETNRLDITVSGVKSSTGRRALHDDIRKFKKDMVFNYVESGKMISCYDDDQPTLTFKDKDGRPFTSTQKHGIALMPTTYSLTIDPIFEALWENEIEGGIYLNV